MVTFQALGRYYRVGQKPAVVLPYEETVIARRIAEKMKHVNELPTLVIHDETVLLKNGQILLLGPGSEGVGKSLHPEGGLDKK